MDVRKCLRSCFCDCACVRWPCWNHWRMWCKPLMIILYLMILFVVLPLLIYGLHEEGVGIQFRSWFVAGIFMLLTIPIFLLGLMQHLFNYTKPHLQKHIIRILWIVPIYSLDSWLGLKFPETAVYFDTVRECYEAYVLYNFLRYLLNFLEFEYDLQAELEGRPPVTPPVPFCCCPAWPKGLRFIRRCKIGVLQYTVVRLALTLVALITQICGVYDKGHIRLNRAFLYIGLMNAVSQIIALHSLIYFYKGTRKLLKPLNPVGKFLSIKAIVFFTFWQSLLISLLVKIKAISNLWSQYHPEDIAEAFQNFIICIEMLLFAIAHYFVFSHKPYVDPAAARAPCIHSCLRMLDVRDVADDMKEHFVDPISRPSFERIRRRFGDKSEEEGASGVETESDRLLKTSASSGGGGGAMSSTVGVLNDGSLSFSVMSANDDDMKIQHRVTRPSLTAVVEEEKEPSPCSSSSDSSNTSTNEGDDCGTSKNTNSRASHTDSAVS